MTRDLLKTSKAFGDETRLSIYHYLEHPRKEPFTVGLLARQFKLHPNAIRQHLAKLEEAGLIQSDSLKPSGSGRPRRVYKIKGPVHPKTLLPRDYKLLCEMLLDFLASSRVSIDDIKLFGQRWGKRLVQAETEKGTAFRSPEEIVRLLISQFSSLGFDPELISLSRDQIDVRLRNCIFREVVDFHPDLVCPLLHGVLEGILSPAMGHWPTVLENGIAHGKGSCEMRVKLKTVQSDS